MFLCEIFLMIFIGLCVSVLWCYVLGHIFVCVSIFSLFPGFICVFCILMRCLYVCSFFSGFFNIF